MTGPLSTIDIYRLPGPARRRQYQTTWRPVPATPRLSRVSTTGCSRGQARPSSTRLSGITPALVASRSCRGWTLSPSSGIHPLRNPKSRGRCSIWFSPCGTPINAAARARRHRRRRLERRGTPGTATSPTSPSQSACVPGVRHQVAEIGRFAARRSPKPCSYVFGGPIVGGSVDLIACRIRSIPCGAQGCAYSSTGPVSSRM
jgi:hypothetical protein